MADKTTRVPILVSLAAVVLLAIMMAVMMIWFYATAAAPKVDGPGLGVQGNPGGLPRELSLSDKRELLKLSHQAIGLLENELWRQALPVLAQIQAKLPEDSFAARNSAVALSVAVEPANPARPDAIGAEVAEETVSRLLKVAPKDPVTYILAARIAAKSGNSSRAIERYRQAVKVDPQSPVAWYELFEILRNSGSMNGDPAQAELSKKEQLAALSNVAELRPDNLRVLVDMLGLMLETQDNSIAAYLRDLAPQIPRVRRASLERFGRDNFQKIYENAVQAAEKASQTQTNAEWSAAAIPIRPMINLLTPLDPVYMDMAKLRPNGLDFVQYRFTSAAMASADIETAEFHPAIEVKFKPAAQQVPAGTPPLDTVIADYDLDQRPDIWVLTQDLLRIYGSTTATPAWHQLSEVKLEPGFTHLLATDLDLDDSPIGKAGGVTPQPDPGPAQQPGAGTTVCQQADPDLVLYGPGGVQIWKNQAAADGQSRSWIRAEKTGLEELRDVTTVTAADIDHDGDLDLAIVTKAGLQIWSNREEFVFKDISEQSTLPSQIGIRQIIPVDWDRDVDLDLLVLGTASGEAMPFSYGLLQNRLHGALEWRPLPELPLLVNIRDIRQGALLDADQNASWDLAVVGSESGGELGLTTTHAAGQVNPLRTELRPDLLSDGLKTFDYDNDGYLDLLSWQANRLRILRGGSQGAFSVNKDVFPNQLSAAIQDCATGDLDGDGDLDLLVRTANGIELLTNEGGNRNHWLDVRLRARTIKDSVAGAGLAAKRVNHQGIGSLVELQVGGSYQPQVVAQESIHFGLGQRTAADLLRVVWTNGVPQGLLDVKGDWEICEIQAPKGSCPFAYTWNGERYEFFTDLLWNAPLGLQFAEGVVAPARAWEYLKIPGNRLLPQGDQYVLQITEELWEATYFDQVELLAVDHPADVEIYSNEKVGPASLAEFKIHTVKQPQPVVAAKDQRGRDVFPEIAAEDGVFTKCYDQVLRQGLTTEHFLELDLGKRDLGQGTHAVPLTIFLTGWMYPTETSISVAVSQNPKNAQARPPALWIPDKDGKWTEVRPFMGFPGGKTKTIAIDLTGVFTSDDHRLRIVTNMQFHWDHAFVSVGETPAEFKMQPLKLASADLHYRGLSKHSWPVGNGPDQYDYSRVLPGPEWPPMQGFFTRYGDVQELLTKSDDQLAVIGAGDEMTLKFSPPDAPLPAGWKRDFILHSVGWDKDADLNTLYSQTVEPLPFNAMSGYPYGPEEGPPETPEYRRYLQKYQTRVQDYGKFWRKLNVARPVTDP
ncbi:MAG: hypothetical protein JWN70_3539 [Planctomycetaceae bacterium]|nr:hypothetical protein [Planctomycetaceae bacterium]